MGGTSYVVYAVLYTRGGIVCLHLRVKYNECTLGPYEPEVPPYLSRLAGSIVGSCSSIIKPGRSRRELTIIYADVGPPARLGREPLGQENTDVWSKLGQRSTYER
jgi:hypothetical protein